MMRQHAVKGEYEAAEGIGYRLLEENGAYHDAALYLARILGWQSNFDSAYHLLDQVISQAPDLFEAYQTCADLAYWDHHRDRLDSCIQKALELEPDSAALFEKYRQLPSQSRPQQDWPEIWILFR